jgi:hypothetical protein
MATSQKLSFIGNSSNPVGIGPASDETICFSGLEFTVDRLGHLSLPPKERGSCAIFIGMVHNGSPSLHITLEDSSDEDGTTLGAGGSSGSLGP